MYRVQKPRAENFSDLRRCSRTSRVDKRRERSPPSTPSRSREFRQRAHQRFPCWCHVKLEPDNRSAPILTPPCTPAGSNDSDIEILEDASAGTGNSGSAESSMVDEDSLGRAGKFKVWSEERVPVVAKKLEEQLYHQIFWLIQENRDLLLELKDNRYGRAWSDRIVERIRLNSTDVEGFLILLKGVGNCLP